MPDSPTPAETLASAHFLLHEAIGTLAMAGIAVTIDGQPSRYVVDGQTMTEGDLIALAARVMPIASVRVQ